MVTNKQRLQFINGFLKVLRKLKPLVANSRNERIFELSCYFQKANELINRGKTPLPQNVKQGRFTPHSKPGDPFSASYISFQDASGETFDLFLNGRFRGKSGVRHSPDIVLKESKSEKILSIYECKNHSGKLNLNHYREFIGYLEEMKVPGRRSAAILRNLFPETRPSIYTSATANMLHAPIRNRYDFDVIDRL